MKTLFTLQETVNEIQNRHFLKKDYAVPTEKVEMVHVVDEQTNGFQLALPNTGNFHITDHTHGQIASRLDIPKRYYDRMMVQAPELFQENVNHWFRENPETRLVRTLGNQARAFLSDRFKILDNEEVLEAVIDALGAIPNAVVLSSGVTDSKMYLKIIFPDIEGEVLPGDTIHMGICISNGEIGNGSLIVEIFFYRSFCTNGCVFGRTDAFGMKRVHLGGKLIQGSDYKIISSRTQRMQIETMKSEMRDVLQAATDEVLFNEMVAKLRASTEGEKIVNPERGIEELAKTFTLSESERQQAMVNLIQDRDYSRWGALNAITKIANDHASYDRASELEALGGKVLTLSEREWHHIATAA